MMKPYMFGRSFKRNNRIVAAACVLSIALLSGCGGGTTEQPLADDPNSGSVNIGEAPSVGPATTASVTASSNGVQVSYTNDAQRDYIDVDYVAAQWEHMQSCLGIVAAPPKVIITQDKIELITNEDDAVRDFQGRVQAASSVLDSGVIMQVSETDFDVTLGDELGGYLRSIMGRYLWLSDQQPERNYPYNCASNG